MIPHGVEVFIGLVEKSGREPGPDDPIFFDMDEDTVREGTANAMRERTTHVHCRMASHLGMSALSPRC